VAAGPGQAGSGKPLVRGGFPSVFHVSAHVPVYPHNGKGHLMNRRTTVTIDLESEAPGSASVAVSGVAISRPDQIRFLSLRETQAPGIVIRPATPKTDDLRPWRTERLGVAKRSVEYKSLPPALQKVVDYMVRATESPDGGMFTAQTKLAKHFGVSRKTMNAWLGQIVAAGVFTVEKRARGLGTKGGRTTNRYRLSEAVLTPTETTEGYTTGYTTGYSGSTYVQAEASLREASRSTPYGVQSARVITGDLGAKPPSIQPIDNLQGRPREARSSDELPSTDPHIAEDHRLKCEHCDRFGERRKELPGQPVLCWECNREQGGSYLPWS